MSASRKGFPTFLTLPRRAHKPLDGYQYLKVLGRGIGVVEKTIFLGESRTYLPEESRGVASWNRLSIRVLVDVENVVAAYFTGSTVSRGGFCCVQDRTTNDEGKDLAATATFRGSSFKLARFHELKRQASASSQVSKLSPELRKRDVSPPLWTVHLRGRPYVKRSSQDTKVS